MAGFDPSFLAKYSKNRYEEIMQASEESCKAESGGILSAPAPGGGAALFGVSASPVASPMFGIQPAAPTVSFGVSPAPAAASFGVPSPAPAASFGVQASAAPMFGVTPTTVDKKRKREDPEDQDAVGDDRETVRNFVRRFEISNRDLELVGYGKAEQRKRFWAADSKVLTNGSNMSGQLGFKTAEEEEDDLDQGDYVEEKQFPSHIEDLSSIVRVAAGGMHNLVLDKDGQVFSWGCNDDKCLGQDPGLQEWKASLVEGFDGEEIIQIDGGNCHSAAVTSSGKVYTWGLYRNGEGKKRISEDKESHEEPTVVEGFPKGTQVLRVASGGHHTLAITTDGKCYGWGCLDVNQVQLPPRHGKKNIWKEILLSPAAMSFGNLLGKADQKIVLIACGSTHSFAMSSTGKVLSWGCNNEGQLGLGDAQVHEKPGLVEELSDKKVCMIAAGDFHSMALTKSGSVYSFGIGIYGQLGQGEFYKNNRSQRHCATPKRIDSLEGMGIRQICCGSNHTLAVSVTGSVYAWGQAGVHLGLADEEKDYYSPKLIKAEDLDGTFAIMASAGGQHSIILTTASPMLKTLSF